MCNTVNPFVYTALLANVLCDELFVWLKASDFWYTINIGPSLKLVRCPTVAPRQEDSATMVPQDHLFHLLRQVIDWINIRVVQIKALDVDLGSC